MKTLILKMSIPVLAIGFVLTTQLNTQAYLIQETAEPENEMSTLPTPYKNQLTELDEQLHTLNAELDKEQTISFEQYEQYQSTLNGLLQDATAISRDIKPDAITTQYKQLVTVQEKLQGIDVK